MDAIIIPIGHNNFLPANKILTILSRETRAITRMISKAKLNNRLLDATNGRRLKTVILTTDEFIVLSSISPKKIAERYIKNTNLGVLPLGADNFVPNDKVTIIMKPKSSPVQEMLKRARGQEKVIKTTMGKRQMAVVMTTTGYFIATFIGPKTLYERFQRKDNLLNLSISNDDINETDEQKGGKLEHIDVQDKKDENL